MENNSFAGKLLKGMRSRLRKAFNNPYREVNISWPTLLYYKHLPANKERSHLFFGKKFYFNNPPELLHLLQEIYIQKLYRQELRDRPYIIDCGANIGLSVVYMKNLYPEAEVLAFEPDEKNFDLLSKNIVSFGYKDITLRKEAVWKENTTLKFSNEGATTSKIESKPTTSSKDVKATRLKDFLDREIDFLKIDIEGAEFEVVMDLSENLHHIKNLFIEYHGSFGQNNELLQILNLVCEKGFNFYIKEATPAYQSPFYRLKESKIPYDIQLNIFCFRKDTSNT